MTRTILTVWLLVVAMTASAQIHSYTIKDVGLISIPSNMELQDANIHKQVNEYVKKGTTNSRYISGNRVVFQQSGFNNNENDRTAFNTYARVIINTSIEQAGAFDNMNTWSLSNDELRQLDDVLRRQQLQDENQPAGMDKLIAWHGSSITTINGCKAIKTSYLRQLNDNPPVYVEAYMFQNDDRMHQLILSYRQKDEKLWKPLYSQILNSFKITNIR